MWACHHEKGAAHRRVRPLRVRRGSAQPASAPQQTDSAASARFGIPGAHGISDFTPKIPKVAVVPSSLIAMPPARRHLAIIKSCRAARRRESRSPTLAGLGPRRPCGGRVRVVPRCNQCALMSPYFLLPVRCRHAEPAEGTEWLAMPHILSVGEITRCLGVKTGAHDRNGGWRT